MISFADFLALKEEKMKLEREGLRLKNEIFQLKEIKEQILPMKTFLIDKYKEQNQEKDEKIASLESTISILRNQITIKSKVNKNNNQLLQQNQELKEEICSLKVQCKQIEEEYSEKSKQTDIEIQNLKTILSQSFSQQNTTNESDEIIKKNNKLNTVVEMLSRKYKSLKIKSDLKIEELTQQNKEKEAEIQSLREIVDMKEAKIKSLEDEISKLKSEHFSNETNNLDKINELNRQIQEFKAKINELVQKNEENETKIKSLQEIKTDFVQFKNTLKINELNIEKTEISQNKSTIFKSENHEKDDKTNQQIQDLKTENDCSKRVIQSTQENNLQNQSNDNEMQPNQNLCKKSNKTQTKNLESQIKKRNKEIKNKEKMIDELKMIINMNQDKINRMETEIFSLSKQLEIYQKNNEQISDFIQSYKKQNLELIKMAFVNIQKTNHSLKSEIDQLDLPEKFEEEKKNNFVDELRMEMNDLPKLEILQNNDIISNETNNKLLKIKKNNINLKNKNNKLKEIVKKLIGENDKNQSIIANLNEEMKDKNKKINELNNQISALISKKDDENEDSINEEISH